jgi:hypothetical protein
LPTKLKCKKKRVPKKLIEHQLLGLMPTKNINLAMRLIKLFPSSIVKILAGKLMFASFQRDMPNTDLIAWHKRRHRTLHNSTTNSISILRKEEKVMILAKREGRLSLKPSPLFNSGIQIIAQLTRSQTT